MDHEWSIMVFGAKKTDYTGYLLHKGYNCHCVIHNGPGNISETKAILYPQLETSTEGIVVIELECSEIAYHCQHLKPCIDEMTQNLRKL